MAEEQEQITNEVIDQDVPGVDEFQRLMNGEDEPAPEEKPAPEPAKSWKFSHGGKEITATEQDLLRYAQQGYGAPTKIGELNTQLKQLDAYRQVDEWAKANPDKWSAIEKQWGNSQSQEAPPVSEIPPEVEQYVSPLMQRLEAAEQKLAQWEKKETEVKTKQEDELVDTEIKSIREKYVDLDWSSVDSTGYNLEMKVLDHASKNGFPSFQAAFKDMMFDKLMDRAVERGKEKVVKERQERRKLGFLDFGAPEGKPPAFDPKTASAEERFQAALNEWQ